MAIAESLPLRGGSEPFTAHQRLERRFARLFWGSIVLSTLLHFVLFRFFPALQIGELSLAERAVKVVPLPPEIEVPPPPARIERPAIPVVARRAVAEDVTIAPTTFEENPIENLPPPPEAQPSLAEQPVFTPYEVRPELKDVAKARDIVLRRWPPVLRDAGIQGTVVLLVFIDEKGRVRNHTVAGSSGFAELDAAAVEALYEIGREVGFTPALNRDRAVPVWVRLPIIFSMRAAA